ncbi:WD40-repeat-containing domain protein [Lophiotrema nucula]|uniref:WD40-repeat-containing domain protein n=1 Tax=Lophiotrema nucula TaxID=690887 RepID=A0A6A5YIV5_9PLEO|nr:WD40-repeat-containing domain protein [Lophiotrema nucula]
MHRRPSILSHRPKTSSAADERDVAPRFDAGMKRTASQTFHTPTHESRDIGAHLTSVMEGASVVDYAPSQHSHSSSFSRASQAVGGSFKQICRRLSSSSTRRPSLASIIDMPIATSRKSLAEFPHQKLQHQDSGVPPMLHDGDVTAVHSKFSSLKGRFGSIRRRPATSGPSGESARYNPAPVPIPANYPTPMPPGHAARAAAAANNERLILQKREQELTARFLAGHLMSDGNVDDVIKDSESGVGMETTCPPLSRTDSVQEKRLDVEDPIKKLPAELTTMILSNLDAATLIKAERLSHAWRDAASSPHVWRSVFLRRFAPEIHVTPAPIMMGGAGIGKFSKGRPQPGQDWKKMYSTRLTINRRWKGSSPSAIYLNGHTDSVYCCQFDESKIITGSRDRTIRVWDMKTYKCIKVIGGPANIPIAGTPAPLETHQEMVISHPSMNGKKEGSDIYYQPSDYHEASILCLQYDDRIMVTGSSDHTCIVWDITEGRYEPMYRLRNHTAGVLDVCLDDKHIISCSKDASINVWDRATGTHIRTLTGHRGPVNAVQLRGHLLVSASGDGIAKLWNLESGACIKEFPSQDRGLAAVEFSDDAKYVLAGGNDHVVYKFDALSGQLLHTSDRHGGLVRSLFLDAHNGRIVSGSYDQSIRIADYHDGTHIGTFENWTTSWILSAKSDYRRVVATSQDGRALILDFGWRVEGAEGLVG